MPDPRSRDAADQLGRPIPARRPHAVARAPADRLVPVAGTLLLAGTAAACLHWLARMAFPG